MYRVSSGFCLNFGKRPAFFFVCKVRWIWQHHPLLLGSDDDDKGLGPESNFQLGQDFIVYLFCFFGKLLPLHTISGRGRARGRGRWLRAGKEDSHTYSGACIRWLEAFFSWEISREPAHGFYIKFCIANAHHRRRSTEGLGCWDAGMLGSWVASWTFS